jgi:hypothetical protein
MEHTNINTLTAGHNFEDPDDITRLKGILDFTKKQMKQADISEVFLDIYNS